MIQARTAHIAGAQVRLDALPDVADFRDRLFSPSLVEIPPRIDLTAFRAYEVPVRHQGAEGSCTGFALSTVAHYLLRRRRIEPDRTVVSARMFYEMAKRYDEWPGEDYQGSSARGAMKGWQKHGVCSEDLWSYEAGNADRELTNARSTNALKRPLGAYFRVNHKDLVAMHAAIAEVGILLGTALIHDGWYAPAADGTIFPGVAMTGGHAFAIVGYNAHGFWLQNSWGDEWGVNGCALLTYDDWLQNAMDVWVAQLGAPVNVLSAVGTAAVLSMDVKHTQSQPLDNVRPFVISVDADGRLRSSGTYATTEPDIARIFAEDIPGRTFGWRRKRLLLYAHGGLVSERQQLDRVLELGKQLLQDEVYLLAFHWHSGLLRSLSNVLVDALQRRDGQGRSARDVGDFMADRLDDALEPLARTLSGKLIWDNVADKGRLATRNEQAAGRIFLKHLTRFLDANPDFELHVLAHSVGSIFLAPLIQRMTAAGDAGLTIRSCTLWAPANSMRQYRQHYRPAINAGRIELFTVYTLADEFERDDDVVQIYQKSLLYLIAHAFGDEPSIPLVRPGGEPLLGLARDLADNREFADLGQSAAPGGRIEWVVTPNCLPTSTRRASAARTHLDFETDKATIRSTLQRIDASPSDADAV